MLYQHLSTDDWYLELHSFEIKYRKKTNQSNSYVAEMRSPMRMQQHKFFLWVFLSLDICRHSMLSWHESIKNLFAAIILLLTLSIIISINGFFLIRF